MSLPIQGFIVMTALVALWYLLMFTSGDACIGWAVTAAILYLLYSLGGRDGSGID